MEARFEEMAGQLTTQGFAVLRLTPEKALVVRQALQSVSKMLALHRDKWFEAGQPTNPQHYETSPPARVISDTMRTQLRWAGGPVPPGDPAVDEATMKALEGAWPVLEDLAFKCLAKDPIALAHAQPPRVNGSSEHIVDVFLYGKRGKGPSSATTFPMEPHFDRGLLTIVMADRPGLEVFVGSKWQELDTKEDDVVIMAGTGWSNLHVQPPFMACNHRVKQFITDNPQNHRCSFTFEVRPTAEGWKLINSVLQQRADLEFQAQRAEDHETHSLPWVVRPALKNVSMPLDLIVTVLSYLVPLRLTREMKGTLGEIVSVAIDAGSCETRAMLSSMELPEVFPSLIGRPRHAGVMVGMGKKDAYVGMEAASKRGILTLKRPIERGLVVNWDDMEKLWHHTFYNELRVAPEEHCIVVTEAIFNPKAHREKVVQIMFETFNCPALFLVSHPVAALFSSFLTTGLVVDIGSSLTHIVPVVDGMIVPHAVTRLPFGGDNLTDRLAQLAQHSVENYTAREAVEKMKKAMCAVAIDCERDVVPVEAAAIGRARYDCPEMLFKPRLADIEAEGIPSAIVSSVSKCEADVQKALFANILVTGGSSALPGLASRLAAELQSLVTLKVSLLAPCQHASCFGASNISRVLPEQAWIPQAAYDEIGPSIVHSMCI